MTNILNIIAIALVLLYVLLMVYIVRSPKNDIYDDGDAW